MIKKSKRYATVVSCDDNSITFSNGCEIEGYHDADCCEYNYADFKHIYDEVKYTVFDTDNMQFETCQYGFRFGDGQWMYFVPCYSEQDGYYSNNIDIYWNDKCVIKDLQCDGVEC